MNDQSTETLPLSPWKPLALTLLAVGIVTLLADFLFWDAMPGLSLALFVPLLAGILWYMQGRRPRPWGAWALLAGASVAAALQTGFSNSLVLIVLALYLTAETFRPFGGGWWARWSESCWNLVKAPFRWLWLGAEILQASVGSTVPVVKSLWYGATILVPVGFVLLFFALTLGMGNAIYGHWMDTAFSDFFNWLWNDLTILRLMFWAFVATIALALVRPSGPYPNRFWQRECGRFGAPSQLAVARWRSVIVLVVVNLLYLGANGIDSLYLWQRVPLPCTVTLSDYLHEGVYSLIVSVLMAGLILTVIHQQADAVITPAIRWLSHLWILQNALLIVGVLKRLHFYVDEYALSQYRLGVAFFLLLVTTGFLLLAIYLHQRRSFNWLLSRCAFATFALFYVLQFCDTAQWTAAYNFNHRHDNPNRPLDVEYLHQLGPTAWPYLAAYTQDTRDDNGATRARYLVHNILFWPEGWRSWQWRTYRAQQQVQEITEAAATRAESSPSKNDQATVYRAGENQ